jgi:hypothetical protein
MYICDSEKTLFINIVLRYIAEAGNRYILSLLLYIVLNDEFLPVRVDFFRNIRSLAASALVLGYYYFLVFLAFVAPKKKTERKK